jgi:hypothetical protein
MSSKPSHGVSTVQETEGTSSPGSHDGEPQKPLMASVALAILGAIVVWAILQVTFPLMTLPKELAGGHVRPPEVLEASMIYEKKMAIVNPTFAMGVFGAVLGGMAAMAWLGKQRSKLLGLLAAAAATLIGGGFGCLAGYSGLLISKTTPASGKEMELAKNLMMHVAMLSIVGAGVGLVVGALMIRAWKAVAGALVAGIAAGFLAGAAFVVLMALLFTRVNTALIIPGTPERILWIGLTALLTGWIIAAFTPVQRCAGP